MATILVEGKFVVEDIKRSRAKAIGIETAFVIFNSDGGKVVAGIRYCGSIAT